MTASKDAEPHPQHEATNPHPPSFPRPLSLPDFPVHSDCPSLSKDLRFPHADLSTSKIVSPSLLWGESELRGCSVHDDGIFPLLPSHMLKLAPTHLISQRLQGHPPFSLEGLTKGGAQCIQGLTKAACRSTMQGVFHESWHGGHDVTVSELRATVTQAVAQTAGITWHIPFMSSCVHAFVHGSIHVYMGEYMGPFMCTGDVHSFENA
jgi:hypothetical protein